MSRPLKEINYYLTLFKIKGHETWRANLSGGKNDFDRDWNSTKGGKRPEVTDKKIFTINCVTGEIQEQ